MQRGADLCSRSGRYFYIVIDRQTFLYELLGSRRKPSHTKEVILFCDTCGLSILNRILSDILAFKISEQYF